MSVSYGFCEKGKDSSIEQLHEASSSYKNNRAAQNVTEAERSLRNEDVHAHTPTIGSNQTEHKDYHKEYWIESTHMSTDL